MLSESESFISFAQHGPARPLHLDTFPLVIPNSREGSLFLHPSGLAPSALPLQAIEKVS